jgi:predicted ArsR family transcriptional regulator
MTFREKGAMAPESADFGAQVAGIAALADPVRRALYRHVAAQSRAVSRDDAAAATGVAHHVAKFHLDKLADEGLLEVEYGRPSGRGGPGAGRPAKLYRRSGRQLSVSVPARHYELAGQVMARAIADAQSTGAPVQDTVARAARATGRTLGERALVGAGSRPGRSRLTDVAVGALSRCGYEPRPERDGVGLTNCPFHHLAEEFTDLVCGMNLELVAGIVDGLGHPDLRARLEPGTRGCCVFLEVGPEGRRRQRSNGG